MKQLKVNTFTPLYEFLINSKSTGIIKDPDFVDLGLNSGTLWAKCNIGGEKETDYGHYYQWGGLEPMDDKKCDWTNAPFNNGKDNFDEDYFKYVKNDVCHKGILSKKYDIAYQTYKGNTHIPTTYNFDELENNTTLKWIENYNDSGICGRLFTGKNDKGIFIPAAGFKSANSFLDICRNGFFLSSSINIYESCYIFAFYFNNCRVTSTFINRNYALPVRAVKEK